VKPVGVRTEVDGKIVVEWHAPPIGGPDYHTLCCVDADDPVTGTHGTVDPRKAQKITCAQCHRVWSGVLGLHLKPEDFDHKVVLR